jgi:hypothetical protein
VKHSEFIVYLVNLTQEKKNTHKKKHKKTKQKQTTLPLNGELSELFLNQEQSRTASSLNAATSCKSKVENVVTGR